MHTGNIVLGKLILSQLLYLYLAGIKDMTEKGFVNMAIRSLFFSRKVLLYRSRSRDDFD